MDEQDFSMPSPKRQRTETPDELPTAPPSSNVDSTLPAAPKVTDVHQPRLEEVDHGSSNDQNQNEILDVLMQHVEAEATPVASLTAVHARQPESDPINAAADIQNSVSVQGGHPSESFTSKDNANGTQNNGVADINSIEESMVPAQPAVPIATSENTHMNDDPHVENTRIEHAAHHVDGIPPIESAEPVHTTEGPEWEADSSPYESSSDSDSSDLSSDDSDDEDEGEDGDNDYAMLDPEEAARILMQGDGGSDDEGDKGKNRGEGSNLRTANEQLEDVPPVPNITITEDMKIEELGSVEAVVENNVLIKGKVSGEYQVLESGSLLCFADRTVVGVVAEPLGRVEQPLYTMRFRTVQEIQDKGLAQKGTVVFYVPQHSSFVFTQPLKAFKGSDASNFHDEEVGDEEVEFSDDEAEAEHKKHLKLKRQGRLGDNARARGSTRGGKGGQRGGYRPSPLSTDVNASAYGNGSLEMNYDDVDEEESYTPLTRPTNFHELTSPNHATEAGANSLHMSPPPFSDRGRGRGHHGRGRDQDRGGRRGRGNFRGNNNRGGSYQQHNPNQSLPQYPNSFANQFPQLQFPYPQPPLAPALTPQNPPYPFSTTTSPISPLPKQQFNFNAGSYQASQPYNSSYNLHQQQQAFNSQMPAGFAPQINPATAMQFSQQFAQHQQQQHQQQNSAGWQVNQAAAAEVQRQLEEMMRVQNRNAGAGSNGGNQ